MTSESYLLRVGNATCAVSPPKASVRLIGLSHLAQSWIDGGLDMIQVHYDSIAPNVRVDCFVALVRA